MFTRRNFLLAGTGLGATALLKPAFSATTPDNLGRLIAGAGRASIMLDGLYPIDDFVGEHDPLCIRVLLLEGENLRQAIVVMDITSLTQEVISRMKTILTNEAGVDAKNAVITASHTFSTPHIFTGDREASYTSALLNAFENALRLAIRLAVSTLQPVSLGNGNGFCRIGVNRNINTPFGWWLGANDAGYTDPHVGVISVNGRDGLPLAILMNYSVQPAVMDASQITTGGRLISADLAGAVSRHVETYFDNKTIAFYLVGCAGDQVPYVQASRHIVHSDGSAGRIDIYEKGFALLDLFGQRLADEVIRITNGIKPQATHVFSMKREQITLNTQQFSPRNAPVGPVKTFSFKPDGQATMSVVLMQWGNIALVGVQPELNAILGHHIRLNSPFAQTFVMTMVDGAAKYLPDFSDYERFTYEARSSPFSPGAGEVAVEAIVNQLKCMWASTT